MATLEPTSLFTYMQSTFLFTTLYLVMHHNSVLDTSSPNSVTDKWEVQLRKGCLELAILAALWGGKRYGLEVLRRLESDSDLIVSEGTVYPLLSRLKALGLVESEWVESEGGHPRKYHALTPAGRKRAQKMAAIWARFTSSMSRLLVPLAEGK
jgi:PadR family transcriptional regulator PadR